MTFEIKPEILTIDKVDGLSADLSSLSANAASLLTQTNNLGGSIPESSKSMSVNLLQDTFLIIGQNVSDDKPVRYLSNSTNLTSVNISNGGYGNQWWTGVAYGNNKFVAVSQNKLIATSDDGLNWTVSGSWYSAGGYAINLFFINNRFFMSLSNNYFLYSSDGITWSASSVSFVQDQPLLLAYGNGVWVFAQLYFNGYGYSTNYLSPGGYSITMSYNNSALYPQSLIFAKDKFLISHLYQNDGGGSVKYSYDGDIWSNTNVEFHSNGYSLAYGNNKYLALSIWTSVPKIFISNDGITWNQTQYSLDSYARKIVFANGKFIIMSDRKIVYSNDGITWTETTNDTGNWLSAAGGKTTVNKTFSEILGVN